MQPKHPSTTDEIHKQLSQIWNELPENYFIRLSHSMVQRCKMIKKLVVVPVSIDSGVKLNFIGCIFVLVYSLNNRVQTLESLLYSTVKGVAKIIE